MLNAEQKLQLSSAGFTDREITLHRQKFHNLFNTAPIDFSRNMIGYRAQRNQLRAALEMYENAFSEMFAQCCSNPISDTWGRPVSMRLFNDAHEAAGTVLKQVLCVKG